MYQAKCLYKDGNLIEYSRAMNKDEISLNEYDVEIQVVCCLIRRKQISCFIKELLKDHQEKVAEGIGNAGIGIITDIGSNVFDIKVGMTVIFIIPETANYSGLTNSCVIPRYFCFECHSCLDKTDVCVMIDALIPAYYTLQNKITRGDVILICDAHTPHGQLIIQLLHKKGCKIVAYLSQEFEKDMLSPYRHMIDSYFEGWIHQSNSKQICDNLIKESDGLGYSSILCLQAANSPRESFNYDAVNIFPKGALTLPDVITVLAAGGNLVLADERLMLSKKMCHHLFSKACSVHYVNPTANLSSPSKLGSLFNFLISKLELLEKKEISPPQPIHKLGIEDSISLLNNLQDPMQGSYVVEF